MKQILFFAMKDDLLPVLESVEQKEALAYLRTGQFAELEAQIILRASDIPDLGIASSDSAITSESYLVSRREDTVKPRLVIVKEQQTYLIDQLLNPDTVVLTAGGLRGEGVLLHGRVATASDSPTSQYLMRLFNAVLRRSFRKVKAYCVGPEAHKLLDGGGRLTISLQSPPEFDLTS